VTPRRAPVRAWPTTGAADGALVPRRRPRVQGVEVDSESVLYDETSGRLHLLNSSASAVWWLIDGKTSVDALVAAVADRFADPNTRDDVRRLLEMLGSEELIEVAVPYRRAPDG
jgi:Coenzyme PQQ synthesis protein D (PqqD)